jgi:AraC family transcriptional regulator
VNPDDRIHSSIVWHDAGWDMGFHRHADYECSVVLDGAGAVQVGAAFTRIEAGSAVCLAPDVPHRFLAADRSIRFAVLQTGYAPSSWREVFDRLKGPGECRILWLDRADREEYAALFHSWLRMLSRSLQDPARMLGTWQELLLQFILQNGKETQPVLSLTRAAEYVREHLDETPRMSDLARDAGFSVSRFRALFEESHGMSPKRFQQSCRLQEARFLLRSSDRKLTEIAAQLGFSSLTAFSVWFRRMEGVSPSAWRARSQSL